MEWDQLQAFAAIVSTGTLRAAKDRLGVSHQTVQRRIIGLEQVLGATLFHRGHAGMELTEEGKQLYAYLEPAQKLMQQFEERARDLSNKKEIAVLIYAPQGIINYHLAPFFDAGLPPHHPFYDRQQTIKRSLLPRVSFTNQKDMADIVVAWGGVGAQGADGWDSYRIKKIPYLPLAAPDYLTRHGYPKSFIELREYHLLTMRWMGGLRGLEAWNTEIACAPRNNVKVLEDGSALLPLIDRGEGISLTPSISKYFTPGFILTSTCAPINYLDLFISVRSSLLSIHRVVSAYDAISSVFTSNAWYEA